MAVSLHPTTRPCYIPHWLPSRPPLIISVLRSETVSWMDMHLIQFTRNFLERSPTTFFYFSSPSLLVGVIIIVLHFLITDHE